MVNYTHIYVYRQSLLTLLLKSSLHMIKSDLLSRRSKSSNATSSDARIKSNNLSTHLNINAPYWASTSYQSWILADTSVLVAFFIPLFDCFFHYCTLSCSSPPLLPPHTAFSLSEFFLRHSCFLQIDVQTSPRC